MDKEESLSRGSLLRRLSAAPLVIGAVAALQAEAQAKAPQLAVAYRNKPHGNKECDKCEYFMPNKPNLKANGSCKRVAGSINPKGYCLLWHDADGMKHS